VNGLLFEIVGTVVITSYTAVLYKDPLHIFKKY